MNTKELIYHINHIYHRHADRLRTFDADTDLVNYAMLSALNELAAAMQDNDQNALLARIERVLEAHDSALFADVASGRIDLAAAVQMALHQSESALASVAKSNRDLEAQIASMRQLMAVADTMTRQLQSELDATVEYRDEALDRIKYVLEAHDSEMFADVAGGATDLATAIDAALATERSAFSALTNELRQAQAVAARQRAEIAALDDERTSLQSQLAQLDADNARLTAELRTVRSSAVAPSTPEMP